MTEKTNNGTKARDGQKAIVGYFPPAVSLGIWFLSIETGKSVQELVGEGLGLVMQRHATGSKLTKETAQAIRAAKSALQQPRPKPGRKPSV
jgi:hypothetical protein